MYIGVCGAENFEVTGHVRTEGGHEGSLPPELTYTNVNAHRHLIQHLITPGSSIFFPPTHPSELMRVPEEKEAEGG